MIHNFDIQLQVSLRALEDVVAPALSGAEKHVVEQLMLSIATIGFVKARLPEARRFYRMELRRCIEMAEEAGEIAARPEFLAEAIAAGQRALSDPEAENADFETASRNLRDLVTALSHACVGQPCQARLETALLERSGALVAQYRQWCAPIGFELDPGALPPAEWLD